MSTLESTYRLRKQRRERIRSDIECQPELEFAVSLLRPSTNARRRRIVSRIASLIAEFRDYIAIENLSLPVRRDRRAKLQNIAKSARLAAHHITELLVPDRIRLLQSILDQPPNVLENHVADGGDPVDFLMNLEAAALAAAEIVPEEHGGRPKGKALEHLAIAALRLYLGYRDDGTSLGAKNGFVDFLSALHGLSGEDEVPLEHAAREALKTRRDRTYKNGSQARDKT